MKNRVCTPVVPPTVPLDWLRMYGVELANRRCWNEYPRSGEGMVASRLDVFTRTALSRFGVDMEATGHMGRYAEFLDRAAANIELLLGNHPTD